MSSQKKGLSSFLQEFSIPLIAGVVAALVAANVAPEWYQFWFSEHHAGGHETWSTGLKFLGHDVGLYFLINDVFMVFFFGIAAKEITESCLPGGSLNPPKKAVNPLIATIGGVAGPVCVFFGFLYLARYLGIGGYDELSEELWKDHHTAWGIPTATDIALAWLVARAVFGKGHAAVNFLLLLAVADDAIGLGIIAVFYGDPSNPAEPAYLGLVAVGMAVAFAMRRMGVKYWAPYIFIAGPLSWLGLMLAHLHPALALVPIVPFLPGPKRDTGLFASEDEVDVMGEATAGDLGIDHSPLHNYEHQTKVFVDFGLFFFAMGNAGVVFSNVGLMTWIILASLVVGKTVGITGFGLLGRSLGFPLPTGMGVRDLVMASFIAALGLTVALFVAGAAYPGDHHLQGEAKMGALLSGLVGIVAILASRFLGPRKEGD